MRLVLQLADAANPYVEEARPWELKKDPAQAERLQEVCTVALNLFRQIAIYLAPVLPRLAEQTGELLGEPITHWQQAETPLLGTPVAKFQHLLQRIDLKDVHAMMEESKAEAEAQETQASEGHRVASGDRWNDPADSLEAGPLAPECTFDDCLAVALRVARVVEAEQVAEARKLLKRKLSL